jgi:hypothetical protein
MNQATNTGITNPRWNQLYKISGVAALILGLLFLVALVSLITDAFQPGIMNDWLSILQNNWLVILFKLNAGFDGIQFNRLYGPNLLDIAILTLMAIMNFGLYIALRKISRIWSMIAAVMPVLGAVLFIVTKLAGRNAVMAAGVVISFVMLRSDIFGKAIAFVGILASLLLLVGDFGTTANSPSTIVAILVGIGYILLMTWFLLIGRRLFQLGRGSLRENLGNRERNAA